MYVTRQRQYADEYDTL